MDDNAPTDIPGLFSFLKERFNDLEQSQNARFDELNNKVKEYEGRFKALEEYIEDNNKEICDRLSAIEKKQEESDALREKVNKLEDKLLFSELKSKKQNVIIFNMPQNDVHEKPEVSMQLVRHFLDDILQVQVDITVLEAHRLRRRNKSRTGPLPLIFKLLRVGDKKVMKDNLKKLTVYNEGKEKSDSIFVEFDHYPELFKTHKDELKDEFYKAKKNGLKPSWSVDFNTAQLCLKVGTKTYRPRTSTK